MPLVLELFDEFCQRMNCPHLRAGNHFVFSNGATSDGRYAHQEPPTDEQGRLSAELTYLNAKLQQQKSLFDQCKAYIVNQTQYYKSGFGGAPEPRAFTDLETFRDAIHDLRSTIADKSKRLRELSQPTETGNFYDEWYARADREADDIYRRLSQIQI